MAHTYTIIGADGQEYGPHGLETIQTWIGEGRVAPGTSIRRSDTPAWRTAGELEELIFAPVAAAAAVPAVGPAPVAASRGPGQVDVALLARARSGAGWFYWIAGVSVVNTVAALAGSDWRFILGSGFTEIFNAVGSNLGSGGRIAAVVLDAVVLGAFVLFGVFASRLKLWAFLVGMLVYAVDGAIFLIVRDWISIAFHVFALFCIFQGFQAARQIRASLAD
jgi:hypothetical protein